MQNLLADKKLIIFDNDGTIIDSLSMWDKVDYELIKNHGGEVEDLSVILHNRDHVIGSSKLVNPYEEYIEYLIRHYSLNLNYAQAIIYRKKMIDKLMREVKPKPYAKETLNILRKQNIRTALATCGTEDAINIYAKENEYTSVLGYDLFDVIICSKDIKRLKPDPEIHLNILQALQLRGEDALVVEDSLVGVKSATNAKIDCLAIREEHSLCHEEEIRHLATKYVMSLKEIYDYYANRDLILAKKLEKAK